MRRTDYAVRMEYGSCTTHGVKAGMGGNIFAKTKDDQVCVYNQSHASNSFNAFGWHPDGWSPSVYPYGPPPPPGDRERERSRQTLTYGGTSAGSSTRQMKGEYVIGKIRLSTRIGAVVHWRWWLVCCRHIRNPKKDDPSKVIHT